MARARQLGSSGDRIQLMVLGAAAVAAWGVAAYFRFVSPADEEAVPGALVADGHASGEASLPGQAETGGGIPPRPSAAAASGSADGATTSAVQPSSSSTASTVAAPASGKVDVTACVVALFPADAFAQRQPDFAFICTDPHPRHGITEVQAQVVLGRGSSRTLTEGMRAWATLGWYQLAAYAVLRGACCTSPADLEWAFELACPLDEAMAALERAVAAQDARARDLAVERYTQEARCLTKLGQASNFGHSALPGAGLNSLQQLLARLP